MSAVLTRRAFLDLSRVSRVTVRGVEWVTDAYVMVRADALRTPPKNGKDSVAVPLPAARRLIDGLKPDGCRLADAHTTLDRAGVGPHPRLLEGAGRVVAVNAAVAAEWLRVEWDAITQNSGPPVAFWEKRRGKLTLVGLVMPMRLAYGSFALRAITDDESEAVA